SRSCSASPSSDGPRRLSAGTPRPMTDGSYPRGRGETPFLTTRWSVVLEAGRGGETSRAALSELCSTYWYPLYAYVRRRGHKQDDAHDLTQAFFARLL